jgi:hypothetical protein
MKLVKIEATTRAEAMRTAIAIDSSMSGAGLPSP